MSSKITLPLLNSKPGARLSTSQYQIILIYDVDFVKGYKHISVYFGIQLCSVLANCWKVSKCTELHIFARLFIYNVYF